MLEVLEPSPQGTLDVVDDDSIIDSEGNPLGGMGAGNGDFSAGETYTINRSITTLITTGFKSAPAYDGWVLESGENTNAGGTLDRNATTFSVGDYGRNRQYRGFLSFNTSSLPDNAVIVSVQVKVKRQAIVGTDPFVTHGSLLLELRSGSFSNNIILPHPRHVTQGLISAIRDLPHVCKHLHLPVQSGSNRVLAAMRRRHTREQYLELVSALKAAVPGVQVSTDMIVGFPGETDEDFADTLSLVESAGFHSMFSFKYSERPGTLAAKRLPVDVPEAEKDRRLAALQQLQKGIQTQLHEALVGLTVEVLVDSVSRRRDTELSGRTSGNTVVNFPGHPGLLGSLAQVDVERAGPHSLWGRARALTAPEAGPTL